MPNIVPDPGPAHSVGGFRDANQFFCLLLTVGTFKTVFKDNKSLRSHKVFEIIRVFSKYFPLFMEGSGSVQIITDPDLEGSGSSY
jgi:hypothetical protein